MTVPQIILRAEISEYLAVLAMKRGGLFGGGNPNHLPSLIYQVRKNVSRVYDLDPTNTYLTGNANYLYSLCGFFGIQASYLINSGGSIPSPTTTTLYSPPIHDVYIGTSNGQTVIPLTLPTGALVRGVIKSILTLQPSEWEYVAPNINLLNGVSLSLDEQLFYEYVIPL